MKKKKGPEPYSAEWIKEYVVWGKMGEHIPERDYVFKSWMDKDVVAETGMMRTTGRPSWRG